MSKLEQMYRARTPFKTVGSSKGIRLETCIIPRMMTKLVLLDGSATVQGCKKSRGQKTYICGLSRLTMTATDDGRLSDTTGKDEEAR